MGDAIPRKAALLALLDAQAPDSDRWRRKNRYYYEMIRRIVRFHVPPGSSVLEIGCGTGDLLAALEPSRGVGVDISPKAVEIARAKHPALTFLVGDAEDLPVSEPFDYILLSDVIGYLDDVQRAFERMNRACGPHSRVILTYYNYLWEPVLRLGEKAGWKRPQPDQNWLALEDLQNLLSLAGFQTISKGFKVLLPVGIPLLSSICNRVLANLPVLRKLCLVEIIIARPAPVPVPEESLSCTVVIPARNEKGNIEDAVRRTPEMGKHTEIVFVEGNSSDGTAEEIERVIAAYPARDVKLLRQGSGVGKGDAVRKGFAAASGDVLMILDADLTVQPEEVPKFLKALASGRGEFLHGSRLVYPMEKAAMRFLNTLGNKFFSLAFTWLLDQRFKDTLCGTKVLYRRDYERIAAGRAYFGDFDPFGDFDLIFGAAKLDLKIVEIPIRYRERTYGSTQISRFSHGWLLLRMCLFALRRIKFT
ncbi:MAG: bifunctional class I SAM-dependent methyltransferase/glycosyltransferase family 2 protein [bacterium]|jgi:SAM-dependent methyltransferase